MKEVHKYIIDYIDNDDENNENIQKLTNFLISHKINENEDELIKLLGILIQISNDHHRYSNFYKKIEKIIIFFKKDIKEKIPKDIMNDLMMKNKRITLFLLKEEIANIDITNIHSLDMIYFYPEIKEFIEKHPNEINLSLNNYEDLNSIICNIDEFEQYRQEGENKSYICRLIRNDSVEDFISYVNRTNTPLSGRIKKSTFETNSFLLDKEPSLIEYTAFYGSIQIFQYLRINNVELKSSLWPYAIHGRNAEIIHLLEEDHVYAPNNSFEQCMIESIKCHHNELTNYIKDNLIHINDYKKLEKNKKRNIHDCCFLYYNYELIQDDINNHLFFVYLCRYNFSKIIKILIDNKSIDFNLNETIIAKNNHSHEIKTYSLLI